jgi:ribosomal protein L37E
VPAVPEATCKKCGGSYDVSVKSCPECGFRTPDNRIAKQEAVQREPVYCEICSKELHPGQNRCPKCDVIIKKR